jgi:hypothetical protein
MFTKRDFTRKAFRYVDGGEHFTNLTTRLEGSSELVALFSEGRSHGNASRADAVHYIHDITRGGSCVREGRQRPSSDQ